MNRVIANICHEANRAYCESLGDLTQPKWEDTTDEQKEVVIDGVNYFTENPEATAEDSHANWMAKLVEDGWVYGEEKNTAAKIHPNLVPYFELSQDQQVKDSLFIGIVRSLDGVLLPPEMPDSE